MNITQLVDAPSGRYSYLIIDDETKVAMLVDPVEEQLARDLELIAGMGATLRYVVETRADESGMSAGEVLREMTGASLVAGDLGTPAADAIVRDGDVLPLGQLSVHIVETPCTDGDGVSFRIGGHVFAGKAARGEKGCHDALRNLPRHCCLWPGHRDAPSPVTRIAS